VAASDGLRALFGIEGADLPSYRHVSEVWMPTRSIAYSRDALAVPFLVRLLPPPEKNPGQTPESLKFADWAMAMVARLGDSLPAVSLSLRRISRTVACHRCAGLMQRNVRTWVKTALGQEFACRNARQHSNSGQNRRNAAKWQHLDADAPVIE
jgi:hypothetical protein